MIKAYVYSSDELGLASLPSGLLELEGAEITRNPDEADVFVCPPAVYVIGHAPQLWRMPFMQKYPDRHVFLDVSDIYEAAIGMPCMFIRCNMRSHWWKDDPNSIPMAWPVRNLPECVDVPPGGFKYDVSFQGWLSTNTRIISTEFCANTDGLNCDFATYPDFYGYIEHEPEGIRRRAEFLRSVKESRVVLCPESIIGVLPYRFFEAMSAGRVPILVSTGYVLPSDDEIRYDDFIVRIPSDQAAQAGDIIKDFLARTPDDHLIEMGLLARKAWLRWLNAEDWPRSWTHMVEKQLGKMALVR